MRVTITPRQTPSFRALIQTEAGVRLTANDIATASELETEGIDEPPISYSLFMLYEGVYTAIEGYIDVELTTDCIVNEMKYNFIFTPEGRKTTMFPKAGQYIIGFKIYPKSGPRVEWRSEVVVREVE